LEENAMTEKTTNTQHNSIASALAAAQAEMGPALKGTENPHFRSKYADLASVMDACLPALNRHGIAVIQPLSENEFGRHVVTRFIHSSGETLECPIPLIVGKQDMQGLGSAITYARRYGLMSLAGIAPEDDDGNAAAASVKGNAASQGLRDAWRDGVLDSLPPDATARQKAEAFAEAIATEFAAKGTSRSTKALETAWDKHAKMVAKFEAEYPDLHTRVVDAYENRMIEIAPEPME
jgi:hypothetical protein